MQTIADIDSTILDSDSLVDVLRRRAAATPRRQAFGFLGDARAEEDVLSYGELDRDARMVAAHLQRLGLSGERAVLLYQPGLDYIRALFGCLYAGVVAVPVYAPRLNASYERVRQTVAAARAAALLGDDATLARLDGSDWHDLRHAALRRVATDRLDPETATGWQPVVARRGDIAILQFTSGSTGIPKGVVLLHGNLVANSAVIRRAMACDAASVGVAWIPPYHDMGLIGGVLQPVYSGFPAHLMSPYSFLQRPMRWLQAMTRHRATHSSAPNFAYQLCVARAKPADLAELDLSHWRVAANGAEPIRADTLSRFAKTFAACGFREQAYLPCYGLAEATLLASSAAPGAGARLCRVNRAALSLGDFVADESVHGVTLVSSGPPAAGVAVRVVDPIDGTPCAPGRIGEVLLQGASVAVGYWDRPTETAATFAATVSGEAGPFMRTGDLGCLHQGELFVTGRIKDVIIIRGQNHYPHDIEATVADSHAALRSGGTAAFALDLDDGEALGVVQEVNRGFAGDLAAVAAAIREAVARRHQLTIASLALVKPGAVPKTSSGKVRRLACRALLVERTLATLDAGAA